jgi:hypothetical protein
MMPMSMYVDILSSALDDWVDELTGTALVEYALCCRTELFEAGTHHGDAAYALLAVEISYDRALIKLCDANDIAVTAAAFAFPGQERARLERELATVGIDLAELARQFQET